MPLASTVFISYSWESDEHSDRVLELADALESRGLEVIFDQYDPLPDKPWPKWMEDGVTSADFVLCVCTRTYLERVMETQPAGTGLGCQWEGSLIYNICSTESKERKKFIPILLPPSTVSCIPGGLKGNTRFSLTKFDLGNRDFSNLYRLLTHQLAIERPERGDLVSLPSKSRSVVPRSASDQTPTGNHSEEPESVDVVLNKTPKLAGKNLSGGNYLRRKAQECMLKAYWLSVRERYDEAISSLMDARKLDGSIWQTATENIIACLANVDKSKEMLEEAHELNRRFEGSSGARAHLALALSRSGNQEGLDAAKKLATDPRLDPHDLQIVAGVLDSSSNIEAAIQLLENSIHATTDAGIGSALGQLYIQKFDYEKASDWNRISLHLDPHDLRVWARYGFSLVKTKRIGLAVAAYREALKLDSEYSRAMFGLASCYAVMGDQVRAAEYLGMAALRDPKWLTEAESNDDFLLVKSSSEIRAMYPGYVPS